MCRDWMPSHAKETRSSQPLWDSLALMSFQVPINSATIAFSGATEDELIRGVLDAAVMMIVLGRLYGAFLNRIVHLFCLLPRGQRPMSLKGGC